MIKSTIRRMMNIFIMDLCQYSQAQLDREKFNCIDDVRNAEPVIALSEDMVKKQQSLKRFLKEALYLHPRVQAMTDNANDVINSIFEKLIQNPDLINMAKQQSQHELAILVSDYIAGMTDRFALQTFEKFCQSKTS
jgi:dGTPase